MTAVGTRACFITKIDMEMFLRPVDIFVASADPFE